MDKYIPNLIKRLLDNVPCGCIYNMVAESYCNKGKLCNNCELLKEAASTIQMLKTQENISAK